MKKSFIYVLIIAGFYAMLYFWGEEEKKADQHPEIHSAAAKPDNYLLEAKDYEEGSLHGKSAIRLEQAIQAIWRLEKGMDEESFDHLEHAVAKLEDIHRKIMRDSIPSEELLAALEYTLNNLAFVELEVAQKYAQSNQSVETKTALKYAQLHLKNVLVLHNPNVVEDSVLLNSEIRLLEEIDSLLSVKNPNQNEYASSLEKLLGEVDVIINRIDQGN